MITWSRQHRIVTDMSLSFDKRQKTHLRDVQLQKYQQTDKMFLNENKYARKPENTFKFIVLWTVFRYQTPKIDTLRQLQSYTPEDLVEIDIQKKNITKYKNILARDAVKMSTKVITPRLVFTMYQKDEISLFYLYQYMYHNDHDLGRISEREIERVSFFVSYFPSIEEYLQTPKD